MKILRLLLLATGGCGTIIAHSLVRAPNRYSTWLAPEAPVILAFNPKLLTNFPVQYAEVGPPPARLAYRIIEPADYNFQIYSTNWLENHRREFEFTFRGTVPARTNLWTAAPRGTVVLLHGYALAQFSMLPWGLRLAQAGWRCVLVDLRGHGKSTGKQIYFGLKETGDIRQLLDALVQKKELAAPVALVGESYGAALALRCQGVEPRIHSVVAIAPYASLSNAVMNIRQEYASWVPKAVIRSGLKKLPTVLAIPAAELDTSTALSRKPARALFVAGAEDKIAPAKDVAKLESMALPGSRLIIVPDATHETLTYFFSELLPPVMAWLGDN